MVSTRQSSNPVEDLNVLSLRSRTIDIASRHLNGSQASGDHSEHETPRKGRRTDTEEVHDVTNVKNDATEEEPVPTVLRPEDDVVEEHDLSPTITAVPRSAPPLEGEGRAVDADKVKSKELDAHSVPLTHGDHSGVLVSDNPSHKRFRSEDLESDLVKELEPTTDNGSQEANAEARDMSNDASDDQDEPETFSTNVKQNLPLARAPREPKSKKPKSRSSAPVNIEPRKPASTLITEARSVSGISDKQLSPKVETVLTSKKRRSAETPASKRVKDITRGGVIYRTISSEGLHGQTSPWLPAKASPESRQRKERLLVRKRVKEVNIGHRRKFVITQ